MVIGQTATPAALTPRHQIHDGSIEPDPLLSRFISVFSPAIVKSIEAETHEDPPRREIGPMQLGSRNARDALNDAGLFS